MGASKQHLFSTELNTFANVLRILGHSARLSILQKISNNECNTNGQLSNELQLAQSTISQHLNELKSIGIIVGTIIDASIVYNINERRWNELRTRCQGFFEDHF